MSDLISRQSVIDVLKETGIIQDNDLGHLVVDEISRIPTAYDIDKVIEELEQLKNKGSVTKTEKLITNACVDAAIEIVKQGSVSDDCCEWESDYGFISDKYKRETQCGYTFYDIHHAVAFKYCPYCGKKIKVVE